MEKIGYLQIVRINLQYTGYLKRHHIGSFALPRKYNCDYNYILYMELVIVYIRLVHPIGMMTDLLSSKRKKTQNISSTLIFIE